MLSPSFSSQAEQEQLVQHWRVRQVWQLLCDAGAVRPEGPEGKWRILQAGAERHLGGIKEYMVAIWDLSVRCHRLEG